MDPTFPPSRLAWPFLLAALAWPTLVAHLYFNVFAGEVGSNALRQSLYTGGKVVQFSLPLLFVILAARRLPALARPRADGVAAGVLFAAVVLVAMAGLYLGFLRGSPALASAAGKIRAKLDEFGVGTGGGFLLLVAFLSLVHSLLEEYYWRWFVFGMLRERTPLWAAVAVSSLGFMSHHVVVLAAYTPGRFWTNAVPASLAVAAGGAAWAVVYHRSRSLLGPWLSHALIDMGIFAVGWDILRGG